eukprot:6674301-Karenia_brevis.AAC.1
MVQTKNGAGQNAWLTYVRKCAERYKQEQKNPERKHGKATGAHTSDPEQEVQKWQAEKEETNRKQAHANMQRAKEHARKAEGDHKQRQRRAQQVSERKRQQ